MEQKFHPLYWAGRDRIPACFLLRLHAELADVAAQGGGLFFFGSSSATGSSQNVLNVKLLDINKRSLKSLHSKISPFIRFQNAEALLTGNQVP